MFRRWLVRSQLAEFLNLSEKEGAIVAGDAMAYLARARRLAPWHIGLGLTALEILFCATLVTAGFGVKPGSARGRALVRWFSSLPGPAPNLVRYYASLVALRALEHPIVRERLNLPDSARRQSSMRERRLAVLKERAQA